MSEFYPLPPDVRRRIEKWLKEHLEETTDSDDIPCVVTHDGGEPDARTFARFPPCGLSPTASAKLAASISAMVEEPFVNELNGVPANYDYRTVHAALFGGCAGYIENKMSVMEQIRNFVEGTGR